jgi:hypothetical protein
MLHTLTKTVVLAVAVLCGGTTMAAAGMSGIVTKVDDKGMATVKGTPVSEHRGLPQGGQPEPVEDLDMPDEQDPLAPVAKVIMTDGKEHQVRSGASTPRSAGEIKAGYNISTVQQSSGGR